MSLTIPKLSLFLLAILWVTGMPSFAASSNELTPPPISLNSKSILILGDSLAAGYGLSPEEGFPSLLQEKIRESGWAFEVVNAGLSGDTSAGGVRRIDWLLKRKVDVLLLELGGNDGLRGIAPEATKTNLQTIIDKTKAKYPDVRIIIAGMQMPDNMGADYVNRFKSIFLELAKENQAPLIPFLLEKVGGRADLNQPDRIHPTAEGHKIVADNVWQVLKPLLASMRTTASETPAEAR